MATAIRARAKAIDPQTVDIRLAAGEPVAEQPLKLICPKHDDKIGSLAVYRANCHCFACGFHIKRRYAALAWLLGEWDGEGDENSDVVRRAVLRIQPRLHKYVSGSRAVVKRYVPPPISEYDVEAFHQYLLRYKQDRLRDELITKRGYDIGTITRWKLGHTGTHFVIPVPNLEAGYATLRYRADEAAMGAASRDDPKYEGSWGRNTPLLYPLPCLRGIRQVEELWIVEGELDALSVIQAGDVGLTLTNGANVLDRIVGMVGQLGLQVGRWVVATDADAAGEVAAQKIIAQTNGVRARWGGGYKDLTEYYSAGGHRRDIVFD